MQPLSDLREGTVFQNFIGGAWITPDTANVIERRNPANLADVIGYVPVTSACEVAAAVNVAKQAFKGWRLTPAPVRGRVLMTAMRILEQRRDHIAGLVAREQGKTYQEALGEVDLAARVLEFNSGEAWRIGGHTLPSEHGGKFIYTIRQPIGVVGLITPWNFPLGVPLWKIAPALVCGNAVVWKPSRLTPLTSNAIAQLFADAGVPAGILNVVHGAGAATGAALVEHPGVRAISFTSSYEVGTEIYASAARQFKKVQCEAGGKNAVVVLADADLELACDSIVTGAFRYAGQRCTATSRVVVEESVADMLVEMLRNRVESLVVGDPMGPGTDMGPIADEHQLARVLDFIEIGKSEGELVCGGGRLEGSGWDQGLFARPTLFDRVQANARIAQEEVFGPMLAIVRVPNFEDAIAAANTNRFGMTAAVFTNTVSQVFEAAAALDCGIVHVNGPTTGSEPQVPFGGIKDTGVGDREMGSTAIGFYSELKVVYVNVGKPNGHDS